VAKSPIQNIEITNHEITLKSPQPSVADNTLFAVNINPVKYIPKLIGIARINCQNNMPLKRLHAGLPHRHHF
jgi:hypothetical protein